jgi:putative acetyltransferase
MQVRSEKLSDATVIRDLIEAAFATHRYSDHTEHLIVEALRAAGALTVSLVAEARGQVVGYIACSPVMINGNTGGWFGLGPVAVRPDKQGCGIGAALVRACIESLKLHNAQGAVLLGEPAYYQHFGFAARTELTLPGVPASHFLCLPLRDSIPSGVVTYHPAFNTA